MAPDIILDRGPDENEKDPPWHHKELPPPKELQMSPEMSADAGLGQVGEQHGEDFLFGNNSAQRDKSTKTPALHPERRLNKL